MADYADINQPQYNEVDFELLLADAINWTSYVSEGKLNASNSFTVVNYVLNAIVWCQRELLLLVETLPSAAVLKFLAEVVGVQRSLGTKSRALVQFTLLNPQNTPFVIEKNYRVNTGDGLAYDTVEQLIIPPGSISGEVVVEAESPGSIYNVAPFQISTMLLAYANLQSAQNIEQATGGSDEETEEQAVTRGARQIRKRDVLISVDDIEDYVVEQLGLGSSVKVVEWYEKAGSNRPGEIEAYILDAGSIPITSATRLELNRIIQPLLPLGTYITIRPMLVKSVEGNLTVLIEDYVDPSAVATILYNIFITYLTPPLIAAGQDVDFNKLVKAFQEEIAIKKLTALTLNDQGTDVLMPNSFTVASPKAFTVNLTLSNGTYYGPYYFGEP